MSLSRDDGRNRRVGLWLLSAAAATLILGGFVNPSRICHVEAPNGAIVHDFLEVHAQAVIRYMLVGSDGSTLPECLPAMERALSYGSVAISLVLAATALFLRVLPPRGSSRYSGRHRRRAQR